MPGLLTFRSGESVACHLNCGASGLLRNRIPPALRETLMPIVCASNPRTAKTFIAFYVLQYEIDACCGRSRRMLKETGQDFLLVGREIRSIITNNVGVHQVQKRVMIHWLSFRSASDGGPRQYLDFK